ncbi:probable serine/threonine-protein kinase PBL10 isoform X1 [Euphorbia lathyris]|uniref:probable serine/threonine-protein kinase PBL10 isoform X1 n=2 Tax=Euphorbia lathyris TaxID=212925 RepID=UPI00331445F5
MGLCLSTTSKSRSALHQEGDSTCMGKCGNDIGRLSSKVSSVAAPLNSQTNGDMLQSPDMKSFCFNELKEATKDFHEDSVLGEGNFGHVYKGWIDEQSLEAVQPETGIPIAVKMLNKQGCQGLQELVAEIKTGKLCHPNLVKLIGYCLEDDQRLLVYEFMPRGSLDQYIFRSNSSYQSFSWNLRLKIALGAAKGLAFLHDEANVIFRDLKTSDILLDLNYNAKLCDFGLAKDGPTDGKSHVSTRALGTEEYSAPEYMGTGHLTKKSDVYSFGVVYLELLSGKQAIDNERPPGEQRLVEWARRQLSSNRNCLQVLDDNIRDEVRYKFSAVKIAFNLAVTCLSTEPRLRPDMKKVVKDLEQLYNPNEI